MTGDQRQRPADGSRPTAGVWTVDQDGTQVQDHRRTATGAGGQSNQRSGGR